MYRWCIPDSVVRLKRRDVLQHPSLCKFCAEYGKCTGIQGEWCESLGFRMWWKLPCSSLWVVCYIPVILCNRKAFPCTESSPSRIYIFTIMCVSKRWIVCHCLIRIYHEVISRKVLMAWLLCSMARNTALPDEVREPQVSYLLQVYKIEIEFPRIYNFSKTKYHFSRLAKNMH